MVNHNEFLQRDLKHVWHPCTQMKDFERDPPLIVHEAKGSYLYTDQGPVIDAISSWWCKSLGHRFPAVTAAIGEQLLRFEHVMGADTTYPQLVDLAEELAKITGLQHTFFASDGSSAVEIAIKLALHASQLRGCGFRNQFIALKNSYHGETLGTLSVSDLGLYKEPFKQFGVTCHFLQTVPYLANKDDPLWSNCDPIWHLVEQELEAVKANACAIIVEPIVQGAGGMHCYSADFLRRLAEFAKANDMYLIADEIMTGLGRTGEWLASHHASIQPDIICLSKGITSGTLPLSCVSIDNAIYQLFYQDYSIGKSFLHSHTYSGNPLAVSAALATVKVMREININEQAQKLGALMQQSFNEIAVATGKLSNIRSIGAIVAGDLVPNGTKRLGYQLRREALQRGAFLRPIGNALYWLPPLTTDRETIEKLTAITIDSIHTVYLK
jgi:adenosylmethionine---8-amino-7-oxononanoate aminotransferase